MSPSLAPPSITATQLNVLLVFSVWAVCESCIEPIPTCSHGEILAVDLNTTNSCCPQYHCGKCVSVCLFVFLCLCLQRHFYILFYVLQCVMSTCALNHLWPVHLVLLWFKLLSRDIAARGTTAVHTQKHSYIQIHHFFAGVLILWLISEVDMPVTYFHKHQATSNFHSVSPRMPMWGQLSPHLSGGKSAKKLHYKSMSNQVFAIREKKWVRS